MSPNLSSNNTDNPDNATNNNIVGEYYKGRIINNYTHVDKRDVLKDVEDYNLLIMSVVIQMIQYPVRLVIH